jgi:UDP-N-acetylglucosamine 2-epimerase (non-hydrolysing)
MIKVVVVIGTRPEAIKMAPIIREFKAHSTRIHTVVVTTGQHRQMLEQVLKTFDISPDWELDIMTENQSIISVTSKVLDGIAQMITKEQPSLILVQGDTTTTFAASLAAYYHKVKVGHVEAGLRTHNKYYPFPEEMNRTLVSALADLHFAPTEWAQNNLRAAGIPQKTIFVTGNTVIDSLFHILKQDCPLELGFDLDKGKFVLMTAHRRENFGTPLKNICKAVKVLLSQNSDLQFIYPVHPNPNVRSVVERELGETSRTHLIPPLDYLPFVHLMNRSYLILTDSGGIQEEAPSLGKPVLVLRNETERPEGVAAGTVKLVGTKVTNIVENVNRLLSGKCEYHKMSKAQNPYGDGHSAFRITQEILRHFSVD